MKKSSRFRWSVCSRKGVQLNRFIILTTELYESAAPAAVNLGGSTDTTEAVTGGLAGLYFCESNIPVDWIESLAQVERIYGLGEKLDQKLKSSTE